MVFQLRQHARLLWSTAIGLGLFFAVFTQIVVPWAHSRSTADGHAEALAKISQGTRPDQVLREDLDERLSDADGKPRLQRVTVDDGVLTVRYRIKDLPTPDMRSVSAMADAREVLVATADSTLSPDKVVVQAVLPDKPAAARPDLVATFDSSDAHRVNDGTRVEAVADAAEHLSTTPDLPSPDTTPAHVTRHTP